MSADMTDLDFLPQDPGLVERIRRALHAHQTENGVRVGLVWLVPDAAGAARPAARPATATPPPHAAAI